MARLKKHIAASRRNGRKATNKGNIKEEPTAVLKEVRVRNGASLDITFEKVLRAKLHKNAKYYDEWRTEQRVAAAAHVVRAAFLPGRKRECGDAKRITEASAYLRAFEVATNTL